MKKSGIGKNIVYGVGNLSYSVISQTITNFFMFFGTSVLKVSGTLVGLAIALSTLWDGFSDTIIGGISDRYPFKKMGKRNGYMLIATFGMAITNLFVWCIPISLSTGVKFIWLLISLIVIETFNTLFATPYSALGNEIAKDYHDRTKVQIFKTIFFLIGIMLPSVLLYIFLPNTKEYPIGQLNPKGYRNIALVTSFICLVTGLVCVFGTLKKSRKEVVKDKFKLKDSFKDFYGAFKIKNLRRIILGYSIALISTTFLTGVGLHFFTYCFFCSTKQITILLFSLILGTIVSQPLWFYMSKYKDKKPSLLFAMVFSIIGVFIIIICYLFRSVFLNSTFYLVLFSTFVCGFGSGALYSLPSSLYADEVSKQNKTSGLDRTATFSGIFTFTSNLFSSVSLFFVGIMLDLIGFDSSLSSQTLKVQMWLAIILFVGVELSLIVGYYFFSLYNVRKRKNKVNMV